MDTLTLNNNGNFDLNGNSNQRLPPSNKSRSNFSHAAVNKSDVGDFQAGYFVMADILHQPQPKPKNFNIHKTLERHNSEKRNHRPPHQQPPHRARSTNDMDTHKGDTNVSQGRLPTSPHRSPTRNNNKRNSNSPPQPSQNPQSYDSNTLSPQKPRKAHVEHESGSPSKDKGPSPTPNRWAGPAFSNAPPPSSLPLPDFPPFSPSVSSSPSLSSSPPQSSASSTTPFLHAPYHQEQFFMQPPLYQAPYPHFNAHFSFAEAPTPYGYHPSLAELSTDLRRMLNITSDPVLA